jgi:hypothetical protein
VAKKATQSDAHDSARFSSRPRQDAADRFAARSLDARETATFGCRACYGYVLFYL